MNAAFRLENTKCFSFEIHPARQLHTFWRCKLWRPISAWVSFSWAKLTSDVWEPSVLTLGDWDTLERDLQGARQRQGGRGGTWRTSHVSTVGADLAFRSFKDILFNLAVLLSQPLLPTLPMCSKNMHRKEKSRRQQSVRSQALLRGHRTHLAAFTFPGHKKWFNEHLLSHLARTLSSIPTLLAVFFF